MFLLRFYASANSVTRETKIHYALYCARLRRQATIKLPPRSRANGSRRSNIVREAIKYVGTYVLQAERTLTFFLIPFESLDCNEREANGATDGKTDFGQTLFVLTWRV